MEAACSLEGASTQHEDIDMTRADVEATKWATEHREAWRVLEREHGLRSGVLEATQFDFFLFLSAPLDRRLY
jgi:hypothetical protein